MCPIIFYRTLNGREEGERRKNRSTRVSSILLPHATRANVIAPATITTTATARDKLTSPVLDSSNHSDEPIANRVAAVTVQEKKTHQVFVCMESHLI
jgi:hypothetical protein